jgi:uncharacterized protein (DUF362 family)
LKLAVRVAVARFDGSGDSFREALKQLGTIEDLDSASRPVVVKVGVFDHHTQNHTSVDVVKAIVDSFSRSPRIYVAESDNYMGTGTERLQIWKQLFTDRVVPFNLSEDADVKKVNAADETIGLSHILFKPNVFVSTHILRTYEKGSILKNLLGLIPDRKKARFHKKLEPALLDVYEAIGGVDLAVLDGTYLRHGIGSDPHAGPIGDDYRAATNIVLLGRDAVAVETVGVALAGLKPEKVPIIREAVSRGLGVGDLDEIEIIGASLEKLKEEVAIALKAHRKSRPRGPQTWGAYSHRALKELVDEGFFKSPNKKGLEDVIKALNAKGLKTEGKKDKVAAALARRVKKGTLRSTKSPEERLYWTE